MGDGNIIEDSLVDTNDFDCDEPGLTAWPSDFHINESTMTLSLRQALLRETALSKPEKVSLSYFLYEIITKITL